MQAQDILEYCLAKTGAYLDYPFGDIPVCVKVKGRIFAQLYPLADHFKITLKCEPMTSDFYRRQYPGIVVRGYHCPPVQQPFWNTIDLNQIEPGAFWEMIDFAYACVVKGLPKKVQRELQP